MSLIGAASLDMVPDTTGADPSPYANVAGALWVRAAGLRAHSFYARQITGYSVYTIGNNIWADLGASRDLHFKTGFAIMAFDDDAEWSVWVPGQIIPAETNYAVGFRDVDASSSEDIRLCVWKVAWDGGGNPTFTLLDTGDTTVAEATVYTMAYEVDPDGANDPINVWLDSGAGLNLECTASTAGIDGLTTRTSHYHYEVSAGAKGGDMIIQFDSEIWNDDDGSGVTGNQDRTKEVMGVTAGASLTSPNDWTPGDADNKKYWMTADHNRNAGTPGNPAAGDDYMTGGSGEEDGVAVTDLGAATGDVDAIVVYTRRDGDDTTKFKICTTEGGTDYGTAFATPNTVGNTSIQVHALTPNSAAWNAGANPETVFNTLQVQVQGTAAGDKIWQLGVDVVGETLTKPAAVSDDVADVASICPAVAAAVVPHKIYAVEQAINRAGTY